MIRAAAVIVLTLTLAGVASAALTVSADQAFAKAKSCLVSHGGARAIYPRSFNLGGLAKYKAGTASWKYKTSDGQVVGVQVWFAGSPGLSVKAKAMVRRCVTASTTG